MTTGISWTDETWNPVTGCSKVSPGCANCYAETLALTRLAGRPGYPGLPWTPGNAAANVTLRRERLTRPLSWRSPRRVFVNSMSDLFHELVPDEFKQWGGARSGGTAMLDGREWREHPATRDTGRTSRPAWGTPD